MKVLSVIVNIIAFLIIILSTKLLYAAGAYLVDDGGVIEKKTLQIENWYSQSTTGEKILVSNPAYQILPDTEFAIQGTHNSISSNANTLWPQLKYLWYKPMDQKNISSSLTAGVNYSSNNQKTYGYYAYIPTTIKFNQVFDLHLYLGWQNWRHALRNNKSVDFLNYGVGTEIHLNETLSLTGELFQANGMSKIGPTKPAIQFGSRYIANKYLILDAIYGKNINGNNQSWMTLGVTVLF